MSTDYGVFEASATDGHEEEQRQRQATRDLGRAIEAAREGFGDFLAGASDKDDYSDRLALIMNDLMQKVADSGVMPVPGVMRKVKAALRPEFRKQSEDMTELMGEESYNTDLSALYKIVQQHTSSRKKAYNDGDAAEAAAAWAESLGYNDPWGFASWLVGKGYLYPMSDSEYQQYLQEFQAEDDPGVYGSCKQAVNFDDDDVYRFLHSPDLIDGEGLDDTLGEQELWEAAKAQVDYDYLIELIDTASDNGELGNFNATDLIQDLQDSAGFGTSASRKTALDIDGSWEEELGGVGYASCTPRAGGGFEVYMWSESQQNEAISHAPTSEEARQIWRDFLDQDGGGTGYAGYGGGDDLFLGKVKTADEDWSEYSDDLILQTAEELAKFAPNSHVWPQLVKELVSRDLLEQVSFL